jgi:hypothetical protein
VKAFLRNEHFEDDLYPILFAWQDGRMPDRAKEAYWTFAPVSFIMNAEPEKGTVAPYV